MLPVVYADNPIIGPSRISTIIQTIFYYECKYLIGCAYICIFLNNYNALYIIDACIYDKVQIE
jgi:hypothetical protein